jgi:DNA-binding transcriptional MerR regulator
MSKSPDAFRTISEVAEWLETPAHVLRFWESKFTQVKPVKRAGGRRYYRPADMMLLGGIKKLLHDDGMTIKGVQKMLSEQGIRAVSGLSATLPGESEDDWTLDDSAYEDAEEMGAEQIEEAPFVEAEAPASTVVPFTGSLQETPSEADAAPETPPQHPLPPEDTAPAPEPEEVSADIPEADLPDPDRVETAEALDKIAAETEDGEPDETVNPAPTDGPLFETPSALGEGFVSEETLSDTSDAPDPAPTDMPADTHVAERSEEDTLLGDTPEFLAKPLAERGESDAPAVEDQPTEPAEPEAGPLAYIGALGSLTAAEAASIAPLVEKLRALGTAAR